MPRRPRPSHHAQPHRKAALPRNPHTSFGPLGGPLQMKARRLAANVHTEGEEQSFDEGIAARVHVDSDDQYQDVDDDEEGGDADAPRVSQWLDEDQLDELKVGGGGGDGDEEPGGGPSQLEKLQNNLSGFPFGALRKAQYALSHAETVIDSEDDSDASGDADSGRDNMSPTLQTNTEGKRVEWSATPRNDIAKRSSKHAPTEVTSKKPVTRLRQVVEAKKIEPRDPRFLSVAGEFKADKYQHNYGFLAEIHNKELNTLRDNLKRARKMLDNAPRHLRHDYEVEVQRLELAVKRAESIVNRERADKIQREALEKVSKSEKEKRKQGKGNWYLKKSEKRELVVHARYEALAAQGGRGAVKKAIEKRQKKISQKEKKSRPFAKGGLGEGDIRKRGAAGDDPSARKRRRAG